MDISPREARVGGQLLRLGVATTVFTVTIVALGGLGVLGLNLVSHSFDVTPFRGWQVYATMAGLTVAVGLMLAAASVTLVRTSRRLPDRTRHRQAVLLAAVLPGLWIGSFVWSPMASAVSWAADHTSGAAAARRQFDDMFLNSAVRPPLMPSFQPPADPATAAHLLHAADLGADWWDADKPNPVALKPPAQALRGARTVLAQQHRATGEWHVDRMILESSTSFRTDVDAHQYVLDVQQQRTPPDAPPAVHTNRSLGVVQVLEATSKSGRTDRFVVGATAFAVTTDVTSTDQATADRILTRAITRATTAR